MIASVCLIDTCCFTAFYNLSNMGTIVAPLYDILLHLDSPRLEIGSVKVVISQEDRHDFQVRVVDPFFKFVKLDSSKSHLVELFHILAVRRESSAVAPSEECVKLFFC